VKGCSPDEVTLILVRSQVRKIIVPHALRRCTIARGRQILCGDMIDTLSIIKDTFLLFLILSMVYV